MMNEHDDLPEWAIFYDDDNVVTQHDCAPENAPAWGVQVVVYRDNDRGFFAQTSTKYYVWDDRGEGHRWYGADDVGMIDYIARPGYKKIIIGRTIPNKRFQELFNRARAMFGNKGSFYRWERRPEN